MALVCCGTGKTERVSKRNRFIGPFNEHRQEHEHERVFPSPYSQVFVPESGTKSACTTLMLAAAETRHKA